MLRRLPKNAYASWCYSMLSVNNVNSLPNECSKDKLIHFNSSPIASAYACTHIHIHLCINSGNEARKPSETRQTNKDERNKKNRKTFGFKLYRIFDRTSIMVQQLQFIHHLCLCIDVKVFYRVPSNFLRHAKVYVFVCNSVFFSITGKQIE